MNENALFILVCEFSIKKMIERYLGVLLNPSMKTSIDVSRQTRKFYAQANMLLRNFRYCSNEVKCSLFKSFCTNMYCCPLWFNSTSSSVKKLTPAL